MKSALLYYFWKLRVKSVSLCCLCALFCAVNSSYATESLSTWNTYVYLAPNIDATNFYNSGQWSIYAYPKPFMTVSTLNYTNVGIMQSGVGWEFDWGAVGSGDAGPRSWSSSFFNDTLGSISAVSQNLNGYQLHYEPVGYLWIAATNIVNKGTLSADPYSEVKLNGSSVDIHRSVVEIVPLTGQGSPYTKTNFTPESGIFDNYWGQDTIAKMNSAGIWNGTNAYSAPFDEAGPCGTSGKLGISAAPVDVSSYVSNRYDFFKVVLTNYPNFSSGDTNPVYTTVQVASNEVRQAVFIQNFNTNFTTQIGFSPSSEPTNHFQTVHVQFGAPYFDFATFTEKTNFLYLTDTLASETNRGTLLNKNPNPYASCSDSTFRPANYVLTRTGDGFFGSAPGMGQPSSDFIFDSGFTNPIVSAEYGAYSANVDNRAFPMPNSSYTNYPGRVRIQADNLNLKQARIRAEGSIIVQASNLVGSAGAIVDCENLSYDLGSTNGLLEVKDLANASVNRFHGSIDCWSAVWKNTKNIVLTENYTLSTNGPVPAPLTNTLTVNLYALIVNSQLTTNAPVTVQDLALHSTNIVVDDSMNVANSLLFDSESLTLNGNLNFATYGYIYGLNGYNPYTVPIPDWTHAIAPKLLNFTNNGSVSIGGEAHFGDDGTNNYLNFVNNGSISGFSQTIDANAVQLNGINSAIYGNFSCLCQTGMITGARIYSERDISFTATSLQFNQAKISAQNALNFGVSGMLSDGGTGSTNSFYCQNGFNLWAKPSKGDLLGTTITTVAYYGGAEVDHYWAGVNYGNSTAGYSNNVAVGTLALVPSGSTNGFEPVFKFFGATGTPDGNGLYVVNLDLLSLSDIDTEMEIDPSLDIYFSTASYDGTNGAEQFLDGKFNNHLHWVQGTVPAVQPTVASVTRFQLSASYVNQSKVQLQSVIMPAQTNIIEASTDLEHWMPIYTNIGSYTNIGPTTIIDPNAKDYPRRFYRVVPGN